jgi:hypothetical protein
MATKTKKKSAKPMAKKTKTRNQPATRPVQRDRMTRPQSERIQENKGEENLNPSAGIPYPNPTTPQRNPETQRDPQDRANHEQWEAEKTVTGGMHYSGEDEDTD